MTPEILEQDWLSFRFWALRCVLPAILFLLLILGFLRLFAGQGTALDHSTVIVSFFTVYFILIRGGHILMMRSLHKDLMKTYQEAYSHKLGYISCAEFKRRNIGFTLARIKRELMMEKQTPDLG